MVWDLEKMVCREVYRTGAGESGRDAASAARRPRGATLDTAKQYEAWDVDEDKPEGMLGRFATGELDEGAQAEEDGGVHALAVGTELGPTREVRHAFLLTGGADRRLRFWDLGRIEKSSVYSGMVLPGSEEVSGAPPKATYTSSQPGANLTLNVEKLPKNGSGAAGGSGGSKGGHSASRPPRSTVISKQQGQLLQSHLDGVTDIAILERPYFMSVSVDRAGVVYVFH